MPRDHLLAILQALNFNNNQDMPDDSPDWLFKLSPVIDQLSVRFAEVFTPQQDISVDDFLFKF